MPFNVITSFKDYRKLQVSTRLVFFQFEFGVSSSPPNFHDAVKTIYMTSCVRIGIAASMLGVCTRTIRRRDAAGKIRCTRTPGGHRRISLAIIEGQPTREADHGHADVPASAAVYCRVSSHEQKTKSGTEKPFRARIWTAKKW